MGNKHNTLVTYKSLMEYHYSVIFEWVGWCFELTVSWGPANTVPYDLMQQKICYAFVAQTLFYYLWQNIQQIRSWKIWFSFSLYKKCILVRKVYNKIKQNWNQIMMQHCYIFYNIYHSLEYTFIIIYRNRSLWPYQVTYSIYLE